MAAAFAGSWVVACSATTDPASGDPRRDLEHADPKVRIRAAVQTVVEQRVDLCELLVHNLDDTDGAVRLFTAVALRKLTSESFGYKPHGTQDERREAVDRWRSWVAARTEPGRSDSGDAGSGKPARAAARTESPRTAASDERNTAAMTDSGTAGATATSPAN